MKRYKILEWGQAFLVTEGGKAWPKADYKRTFRIVMHGAPYVVPIR